MVLQTVMSGINFNSKIVKYKEMISDVLYDEFKKNFIQILIDLICLFVCLFICLFVPLENFSLIWRLHHCQ